MMDLIFTVREAGHLVYEGESWPMARAALDSIILAGEGLPKLVITPKP